MKIQLLRQKSTYKVSLVILNIIRNNKLQRQCLTFRQTFDKKKKNYKTFQRSSLISQLRLIVS